MKPVLRVGLLTLCLLVLWCALVFFGTSEGWWKRPVAPRGDSAAFLAAATRALDEGQAGQAVMALIRDGEVIGVHAASLGAPVDADTVFQTASISKWLTAWGVMALVEQGKLDLDAPVSRSLKRWALPGSAFDNSKVSARRLLSHTAGLSDGLGFVGVAAGAPLPSLPEWLQQNTASPPGSKGRIELGIEPGTEWRYSGGGYALLQLLIEDLSGEPFEAFMQRTVFKPLGMRHSTYRGTPTQFRHSVLAASALSTSVSDLTRFLQAHLPGKGGEPIGRGVLAPSTLAQMQAPTAWQFGQPIWGLGAMLYADNRAGGFIVGHDGKSGTAINTAARLNPATGNGILILQTGKPLLATRLAGDWVFWEAGRVDHLAFQLALPAMLRWLGGGSLAIAIGVPGLAWAMRRRRRHLG